MSRTHKAASRALECPVAKTNVGNSTQAKRTFSSLNQLVGELLEMQRQVEAQRLGETGFIEDRILGSRSDGRNASGTHKYSSSRQGSFNSSTARVSAASSPCLWSRTHRRCRLRIPQEETLETAAILSTVNVLLLCGQIERLSGVGIRQAFRR